MASPKLELQHEHGREEILFSLSGCDGEFYAGGSDGRVHCLNPTGEPAPTRPPLEGHQSYVTGVACSRSYLWSVSYDGLLNRWSVESGSLISSQKAHQKWIRDVQLSPDGMTLATAGDDMKLRLWDSQTGSLIHSLEGHAAQSPQGFSSMLYTCCFSPDGALIASADRIGEILIWEVSSGQLLQRWHASTMYTWDEVQRLRSIGGIRSLCFSPDQSTLAVGGMGHVQNVDGLGGKARIEWFELQSGKQVGTFESEAHKGLVEGLQFTPEGSHLVASGGSSKGFLILLEPKAEKAALEVESPMYVHQAVFTSDQGDLLVVGHHKATSWKLT